VGVCFLFIKGTGMEEIRRMHVKPSAITIHIGTSSVALVLLNLLDEEHRACELQVLDALVHLGELARWEARLKPELRGDLHVLPCILRQIS